MFLPHEPETCVIGSLKDTTVGPTLEMECFFDGQLWLEGSPKLS